MSDFISGCDAISAVVNDVEVRMKQHGYVVAYTEEEIQKIQDLEQAEIEKAYEAGREDALNEIIHCKDCKYIGSVTLNKRYWCTHDWTLASITPNDFCSYAERREENG